MQEFVTFPKIYRVSRPCVITEKIDGTNGQICITEEGEFLVGSRSRWITPEDDNYGFAKWAMKNKEDLLKLGVGIHHGEWWGNGIQRIYDLKEKRFSLFNTSRWCLAGQTPKLLSTSNDGVEKYQDILPSCCGLVPVLYEGIFDTAKIEECVNRLRIEGSVAAPGFMRPEGVVCFHVQGNFCLKKTLEKDEEYKGQRNKI
jgi:hypothetical protein